MATQKTFDQKRLDNPDTDAVDQPDQFAPHEAIAARVVFEPLPAQGHVRVTARTEDYELLWGVTASSGMLSRHPVEVAFYDCLIQQARKHLPGRSEQSGRQSIDSAIQAIAQLRASLDAIEGSLTPKTVSDKTEKRAAAIVPNLNDAVRLLESWNAKGEQE